MRSFDITNINELNASNEELKISGKTNSLVITVDANKTAKILFLDANIANLTVNIEANANIALNFIHFQEYSAKQTINASYGSNVIIKEIASNKISLDSIFNLNGEHASIDTSCLIVAKGFNSTLVQNVYHNAINSNSNIENYGISLDNSEITFNTTGKIYKGMHGSNCKQLSRGIICGEKSAVKSLPILLIDEYDVHANHGAAIGKMSDDELFYLMSRGLSNKEAFKLILSGIINPFMDNLLDESLCDEISSSMYSLI